MTVFAGGIQGSADGKGPTASFNHPAGITIDNSGNIYIADTDNQSVRKAAPDGTVTTFVTGLSYPVGLVFDAQGNLYEVDANASQVRKITPSGVVSILASGPSADYDGPQ